MRTEYEKFDRKIFSVIVKEKCIADKAKQWDILLFKEILKIKKKIEFRKKYIKK